MSDVSFSDLSAHLPAFSACLSFDLMKHDLQSRGMEKGRGGMEGVRGKRRGGKRERRWWKGRRGEEERAALSGSSSYHSTNLRRSACMQAQRRVDPN